MNLTPDDPKLTAYALGELDASERAAVEAALARSPECRRAVEEIRALGTDLTTALAADTATALRTLPSLAPIGGEGRGEEGRSLSVAGSPLPNPLPARASQGEGADAPGEGKVIFLPWRQWRTVGLAAAAALAVGFFVTKVWQRGPAPQLVQHRITEKAPAPGTPAQAQATSAQRPTNQVTNPVQPAAPLVFTNGTIAVTYADSINGPVSVDFIATAGTAVFGGESRTVNGAARAKIARLNIDGTLDTRLDPGVLAYSTGTPTSAARPWFSTPSESAPKADFFYRGTTPASTTPGLVALGTPRPQVEFAQQPLAPNTAWGFRRESTTTAAYPRYVENPFTLVASEPLSTFSTDVDTASYANVRRFLNQNQLPPRDAVRIEELLNYFTYDYAPPTGEHPFAAHIEVAGCPWAPEHRLVRVGLKGRELKADKRPPSNFVFLIDVSGSMSPVTRLPLIKQSLRQLVKRMTENDRVAMVVYASSSGTVLESTSAVNKELILAAIDRLEAGGSTNGGEGIQRAYDLAVANFIKGGVNRVLLCTDGDFNVGITDRSQLLKLIEEKAKSGVFLTTLGVGDDNFKDATLQQLADKGNGNYHYLDSVEEGHKVLVEQMNATLVTIAKDVKIQIEFNPAQAGAYRLIGYEKRILAKEDFNNDAKDAGEIGAGHTVTALYEVVPLGVQLRGDVDPLKYQTSSQPAAKDSVLPTRKSLLASAEWKELATSRAQLEARIAEASKTYVPKHPKMQELYTQRAKLQAKLKELGFSGDLLTLKLRYKAPDGDKSTLMEIPVTDSGAKLARASADFKFASAVVEFGMLLKDSSFKGTATFDSALELAGEGKGNDPHGYRAEFLNLLAKANALRK